MISLAISLSDIEFEKDTHYDNNNIVCTVFLNGTSIDRLYPTQNDDRANLSLTSPSDKVQFVFQTRDNSELIGSIKFDYDNFASLTEKELTQWYNQIQFSILKRIGSLFQIRLKKINIKELLAKMMLPLQGFTFRSQ